jgi:hypothetical protein
MSKLQDRVEKFQKESAFRRRPTPASPASTAASKLLAAQGIEQPFSGVPFYTARHDIPEHIRTRLWPGPFDRYKNKLPGADWAGVDDELDSLLTRALLAASGLSDRTPKGGTLSPLFRRAYGKPLLAGPLVAKARKQRANQ